MAMCSLPLLTLLFLHVHYVKIYHSHNRISATEPFSNIKSNGKVLPVVFQMYVQRCRVSCTFQSSSELVPLLWMHCIQSTGPHGQQGFTRYKKKEKKHQKICYSHGRLKPQGGKCLHFVLLWEFIKAGRLCENHWNLGFLFFATHLGKIKTIRNIFRRLIWVVCAFKHISQR